MPTACAIALGSNLGNPAKNLETALTLLDLTPGVQVQSCSHWYQTKPVGPPQPDFLNGCALLQVDLTPLALLQALLSVEAQLGRERRERWGPRTIDLDLLLCEQLILEIPSLQIPHPRMRERAFVLVPLVEIAPDWVEPKTGKTIVELVQTLDCSDVKKIEKRL